MKLHSLHTKITTRYKKVALLFIIIGCYVFNLLIALSLINQNINLENSLIGYSNSLASTSEKLHQKFLENKQLSYYLEAEKENTILFQDQIQGIKSTVNTLEKLSKTDTELLKKYSKVYFLNENYIPQKLSAIDSKYLLQKDRETLMHSDVLPYLNLLMENARSSGVDILILSAYRSFDTQANLKSSYKVTYGSGANTFSADQGYSEHQPGSTIDFTTEKGGAVLNGFDKTFAYTWLSENAYKYGFVLSYPKNNSYYIFEPWHWRFVGITLATIIHNQNLYFYAMDQREIDKYLVNIFD